MSHTIYYSYHNPRDMVDYFICLFFIVLFMKLFITKKELLIGVISEDVYLGLKRPANLTFTTVKKVCFYGDGRSEYKFQTRPSPSHDPGDIGRLLILSVRGHEISEHRSQTSHHYSYYHCGL